MDEDPRKAYYLRVARKQQAIIQQCIESIRELKSRMEQAKYRLWQIHNEYNRLGIKEEKNEEKEEEKKQLP